ncbi:MAG: hypothetical protein FWG15_04995 [Propionibacteriaceae bacterium]|nr:hypothetical protein [Propionibacteriaceae bacterium]
MLKKTSVASLVIALAITLAGCSSGKAGESQSSTPPSNHPRVELPFAPYGAIVDSFLSEPDETEPWFVERLEAMDASMAQCMIRHGYDFTTGYHWAPVLWGEPQTPPTPNAAWMLAYRTKPDGSVGSSWADPSSEDKTPEDERSLVGSEHEIRIALDDFDCRAETNYTQTFIDVLTARENEFIEAHGVRLQEMVAYAEEH